MSSGATQAATIAIWRRLLVGGLVVLSLSATKGAG